MSPSDVARVSVGVAVPPAVAFDIFTRDIDCWWQRGPRYRHGGSRSGLLHLEPRVGGRLFESFGDTPDAQGFEIGLVSIWEPPHRLGFSWRNINYAAGESTEVLVEFAASSSGTLVTVTHRNLATLRVDHPARHGLPPPEYVRLIGLWWGEQLSALRQHCAGGT